MIQIRGLSSAHLRATMTAIAGLAALLLTACQDNNQRTMTQEAQAATARAAPERPANCRPERQFIRFNGRLAWNRMPSVVVLARHDGDARIGLVRASVDYWNRNLEEAGSGLRLGPVRIDRLTGDIEDYTRKVSAAVLRRSRLAPWPPPPGLAKFCGSIVVVLSDGDFISIARPITRLGLTLVGIKGEDHWPFTLDNVPRNVIAHELGHAIGLGHNADPTKLMCGRPAPCRPTIYESSREKIFPATEREKAWLAATYPPGSPPRRD